MTLFRRKNEMQTGAKHLSRFLYGVSMAILFGVVALSPNRAHAAEHITVTLGQYTITPGVSDQVPVSVYLKWPGNSDTINLQYTAYDCYNNLILNTTKQISLSSGQTFNDTIVVTATGNLPVDVYAEAEGVNGDDDEMQKETLSTFTCPPMAVAGPAKAAASTPRAVAAPPVTFGAIGGMDQYAVVVGAVAAQAQNNLSWAFTAVSGATSLQALPMDSLPVTLSANATWNAQVRLSNYNNQAPVMFNVQQPQGTTVVPNYQLGTGPVEYTVGTMTYTAGPTLHFRDTTVPITQVTVSGQHNNMKLFFSARDQNGKDHECTPHSVSGLMSNLAGSVTNAPSSVKVKTAGVVEGRVTLTAILVLYNNGPHNPPTLIMPASTVAFGPGN
jgi:hypothetical protein